MLRIDYYNFSTHAKCTSSQVVGNLSSMVAYIGIFELPPYGGCKQKYCIQMRRARFFQQDELFKCQRIAIDSPTAQLMAGS